MTQYDPCTPSEAVLTQLNQGLPITEAKGRLVGENAVRDALLGLGFSAFGCWGFRSLGFRVLLGLP